MLIEMSAHRPLSSRHLQLFSVQNSWAQSNSPTGDVLSGGVVRMGYGRVTGGGVRGRG